MHATQRFLCDEMLKGLGRWLRAAGYDTLILEDGESDAVLLKRARDEERLLITRDRALAEQANGIVILLQCNSLNECAAMLSQAMNIDWHFRAFSRCMVCNSPLLSASAQQRKQIPDDAQQDELVLYCPVCDKLYWQGSHVIRMRAQLQRWGSGDFSSSKMDFPHAYRG